MALPDTITKCPHCGSDEGYHYRLTISGTQFMDFGNDPKGDHFTQDEGRTKRGAYRCIACEKVIRAT